MSIKQIIGTIFLFFAFFVPQVLLAQEVHQEFQETLRAEVLEVLEEYERIIMGTAASTTVQELRVLLKSGAKAGEVVRLDNDLVVLSVGDDIFVDHLNLIPSPISLSNITWCV